MRWLFLIVISLIGLNSFAQYWTPVIGKYNYKDSFQLSKFKNNVALDSILTTDTSGKIKLVRKIDSAYLANNLWKITGNAGTSAGTNFLGTTDNQDILFKRNSIMIGRLNNRNISLGSLAFNSGSGVGNIAIGAKSIYSNTTGGNNIGIGDSSIRLNTTGRNNVGIGIRSLEASNGDFNSALGNYALLNNTSGSNNVAVGFGSLVTNTSGNSNTSVGYNSGVANSTGSSNTSIGYGSLNSSSTGSSNIGIGYLAGYYSTDQSNQVFINSIDRTNYLGDTTGSPIWIKQNATVASQRTKVNGKLQINDGTQSSGYVFTSDGIGVGHWGSVASGLSVINGLTLTGSTIKLGGPLTENTLIDGDYSKTFDIDGVKSMSITVQDEISLQGGAQNYMHGKWDVDKLLTANTTFKVLDTATHHGLTIADTTMKYSRNLGSAFRTRSLVDKGYVDSVAALTAGTVTSVSGTSNRITSTGGATPVLDISSSYVGQSSITTLGTIGTGTWQGTGIGVGFGGTGTSTAFTLGSVIFAGASGVYSQDNTNFFWDNTNKRIGMGTTSPTGKIHTLESGISDGVTFRGENSTAAGSTKAFTLGQMGSSGYGITGWASAAVLEGAANGGLTFSSFGGDTRWQTGSSRLTRMTLSGANLGIGITSPTALLHLAAGTATANTAPLKFTSGTLNTAAVAGQYEYNNSHYLTKNSALRYGVGGSIAQFTTDASNTGTGETDLHSYTTPASTLAADGDKLEFEFGGNMPDATATITIKVYFGGTQIYTSGAITLSGSGDYHVSGFLVRVNSTTVRAIVSGIHRSGVPLTSSDYTEVTGLTLSNTNIIKITGQAGGGTGGTGDIVDKLGRISYEPASAN